jgi:hypothetical protein
MVYFQTKNPNLGKFLRALERKMLIYFMVFWNILRTFGKFYDHLVRFVLIWYIFPALVSYIKKNLATLGPSDKIIFSFELAFGTGSKLTCQQNGLTAKWRCYANSSKDISSKDNSSKVTSSSSKKMYYFLVICQ